ncbi:MAG: zinc ribbon domain-containing protein, partial [Chloroflexi bacterium]|nr:zinc ribbon domain-containing protein [Chloroflexota bacterium]
YSLSTGLAEIAPVLGVPLNITDMLVLSKTQAFLVYKLGLALGLSLRWQEYVAEFGGVLGGGFVWRQAARQLVGLIPAWGILPKVAVAYAGTYVVGHVVYRWYLTGRHVNAAQMRQLYQQAFARGKGLAQNLAAKLPRPRRKAKKTEALPATAQRTCAQCGKVSAADAQFCQYCGGAL